MVKILEGIYSTQEETMAAINRLKDQGYSRSDISVVANTEVHSHFFTNMQVDTTIDVHAIHNLDDDHRSLWEKIKDAFTLDDAYDEETYKDSRYDSIRTLLDGYRDEINRGGIAVLIEEEPPTTTYTEDLGANPRDVIDRTHEYDPDRDSLL
ncbi:general stress protein [Trichococcus alkaliphilus]|uniref:general stress protein n=1 Tax=Trichococcus alkaliphilus TaxID=2052943 RepID=UPI001374CADE|nr:general stress protein [Trichococcus alkaliphilus]